MKLPGRIVGLFVAAVIMVASCLVAFAVYFYLSDQPFSQPAAIAIALIGIAVGILLERALSRTESRGWPVISGIGCLVVLLSISGSIVAGQVTYSRFGFTLYGVIPIPALDITIRPNGLVWFRNKTHLITLEELESLASEADVLIVGIGWYEAARVEEVAGRLPGVSLKTLPTPAAFSEYNRLKSEGASVALIAHTTC